MIQPRLLGPAFIRHVEAYGELAGAAARDLGAHGRSRAVLFAGGTVLGLASIVLAGATLIAAAWYSPYRYAIVATVLLATSGGGMICLRRALAAWPASPPLRALREEWQKDRTWLSRERLPTAQTDDTQHEVRSP